MSMMEQGQPESEVVTGMVTGIITKGPDKWQVAVKSDPSANYAKNLWTKDADLVHQVQQLIGTQMQFHCGVSHWNMQDGTPVRSLWINGYAPMGHSMNASQPQQQPGTQAVAQAMAPQQVFQQPQGASLSAEQVFPQYDDDPKQGKIHRQTASKVAAILLGYLPAEERTLDTLLTVSERLVAYYDNGMADVVPANDGMDPDTGEFPPGW
jgi:hypothetical protein